jgi:hypothetical protein
VVAAFCTASGESSDADVEADADADDAGCCGGVFAFEAPHATITGGSEASTARRNVRVRFTRRA